MTDTPTPPATVTDTSSAHAGASESSAGKNSTSKATSAPGTLWSTIPGLILAVSGIVCILIPIFSVTATWWLFPLGAAALALGIFVLIRRRGDTLSISGCAIGLTSLAIGFGLGWPLLLWGGVGLGVGCVVAWGLSHGQRRWWFVGASACGIYLATLGGSLVAVATHGGVWWPLFHGLLTLVGGMALIIWSKRGSGRQRQLAGRIGRIAVVIASLFPYAALMVVGVR